MKDRAGELAYRSLGDVAEFVFRGISYSKAVLTDQSSGIPMVNLANIAKGGGFREDGFKYYSGPPKKGVSLKPGDLVIANTDLSSAKDVLGSPFVIPEHLGGKEIVFTHHITKIIPNGSEVLTSYLHYFLMSPSARQFMKKHGSGTTVMNLQTRALPSLQIPVPRLEAQREIVERIEAALAKVEAVLNSLQEAQRKSGAYRRSLLSAQVTVSKLIGQRSEEIVSFEEFFKLRAVKFAGYKQREYLATGSIAIVDQGARLIGGFTDDTDRVIEVTKPVIVFGDHTRCVKFVDFDFAIGADGVKVLECPQDVEPRFAYFQLQAIELRDRGYARHMGELRKVKFWKPPIREQKRIVELLEDSLEQCNLVSIEIENQLKNINDLRRVVLRDAFEGELI